MASDGTHAPAPPPADRIRVVGAWAGALEVDLGAWTVPMLREEVARLAGDGVEPARVGLIFGGRVLKDDPAVPLQQAGLKGNAKVLSTLTSPDVIGDRRLLVTIQAAVNARLSKDSSVEIVCT